MKAIFTHVTGQELAIALLSGGLIGAFLAALLT